MSVREYKSLSSSLFFSLNLLTICIASFFERHETNSKEQFEKCNYNMALWLFGFALPFAHFPAHPSYLITLDAKGETNNILPWKSNSEFFVYFWPRYVAGSITQGFAAYLAYF
jgi:hypothetical protein